MAESIDNYRSALRSAVRGLWSGAFSSQQFYDAMLDTVSLGLNSAWREGAAQIGIYPDEFTQSELAARDEFVLRQYQYITGFGQFIEQHSKANGGKLGDVMYRMNMWVNRYNDAVNQAIATVGGDKKLKWILGPTEEHCPDCAKYAGRIYRKSVWDSKGIAPQSNNLSCHGYNCECRREPTTERATSGRPPAPSGG